MLAGWRRRSRLPSNPYGLRGFAKIRIRLDRRPTASALDKLEDRARERCLRLLNKCCVTIEGHLRRIEIVFELAPSLGVGFGVQAPAQHAARGESDMYSALVGSFMLVSIAILMAHAMEGLWTGVRTTPTANNDTTNVRKKKDAPQRSWAMLSQVLQRLHRLE
jgi:hypothetical protein